MKLGMTNLTLFTVLHTNEKSTSPRMATVSVTYFKEDNSNKTDILTLIICNDCCIAEGCINSKPRKREPYIYGH